MLLFLMVLGLELDIFKNFISEELKNRTLRLRQNSKGTEIWYLTFSKRKRLKLKRAKDTSYVVKLEI